MPMRMECLDSVDSVGDRIVRFPLRIRRWPNWIPRRFFWISLSSEMGDSMDADLLPELSGGDQGGSHVVGETYGGLTSGGIGY